MNEIAQRAARDGYSQPRKVLLCAEGRHSVAALGDDQVRDEAGAVLGAVEHAQRGLGASDVLSAAAGDDFLDVPTADEVARHVVVPLGGELARADRLGHAAAVRALARPFADRVLDDLFAQPRGIFRATLLATALACRARILGGGRVTVFILVLPVGDVGVAAAQLPLDGGNALGGAPEQPPLVLGHLRQGRGELRLRIVLGGPQLGELGASLVELESLRLSEASPIAPVLARHTEF